MRLLLKCRGHLWHYTDLEARDEKIARLTQENIFLKDRKYDLEQYSRKSSTRVYGVSKHSTGSTDKKLLHLFNDVLKIAPPIQPDDIEVSHRIGKPQATSPSNADTPDTTEASDTNGNNHGTQDTADLPPSRPIIARFTSRKVKARVMDAKKELRTAMSDQDTDAPQHFQGKVFIADDLTQHRARLSYKARVLAREGKFASTLVYDGPVLFKDLHNRIHPVRREEDLPQ